MKTVYENPWFKVLQENQYHFIKEQGSDNGAIIIAKLNELFLFVRVFRQAHQSYIVELPRGYGEINETSVMAAIREFQEETGYIVLSENIEKIGTVKPNSSILCSNIPIFLAKIYEETKQDISLKDKEIDKTIFLTKKEVYENILNGKISDGMSLSALMLYFANIDSEALDHTI